MARQRVYGHMSDEDRAKMESESDPYAFLDNKPLRPEEAQAEAEKADKPAETKKRTAAENKASK